MSPRRKNTRRPRKSVHGQGGVHERASDGRFEVYLGDRRTTLGKSRREEAYKLLNRWRSERDAGTLPTLEAERATLAEYLDRWLATLPGTVSPHTYADYEGKVRLHIKPHLGAIKLRALKAHHLQELYSRLSRTHGTRTVGYVHATLSKALNQAEAWDLVAKNVAHHARPPRAEHTERNVLTADEVRRLFEVARAAPPDRFYALYVLALTTGMRRSELLGLKWRDLDSRRGAVAVRRALDASQSPPVERPPKRKASRRSIKLMPEAVSALESHRRRQLEDRLRAGPRWVDNDYIFPSTLGTPMSGDNLLKRNLRPLLARASLPPLTFHELRHTFATLHLSGGEHPKIVQSILGHASIIQTMDTYSHVIEGMADGATERLRGDLF